MGDRINFSALFCYIILIVAPFAFEIQKIILIDFVVGLQFWIIGSLAFVMIVMEKRRKRSYSLYMMSAFFFYSFVFIAGGAQYFNNSLVYNVSASHVPFANTLIIVWMMIYIISSRLASKINNTLGVQHDYIPNINSNVKILLIVLCLIIGIMFIIKNGYRVLFNRYLYSDSFNRSSSSITSILKMLKSGLGMWTLYFCAIDYRNNQNGKNFHMVIWALIACLILIPPLATSRTIVLVTYGGFGLLFWKSLNKNMNFLLMIILLEFFAAPVFNLFRNGFGGGLTIYDTVISFRDNYLKSDFDSYSMFIGAIEYVARVGIGFGYPLLGVLFFFIPRTIWFSKPSGSGKMIMDLIKTAGVSNISCPLFGEAYVNFGVLGIIIIPFVLGLIFGKIDNTYWDNESNQLSSLNVLYPFFVLFLILVYRGDLLNAFSWFIGFIVSFVLVKIIIIQKMRIK